MYVRNKRYFAFVVLLLSSMATFAQVTIQSPYSKYGLGNIKGALLPQFRGMGGISAGVGRFGGYSNINMANPASYSNISLTTVDAGMSANLTTLKKGALSESSFNSTFSHIALAFKTGSRSGLSLGLMPYSELGYEFTNVVKIDTMNVSQVYNGEGGLSKAYLGYAYRIGNNFRIGANLEYLFGNLIQSRTTSYLDQPTAFNVRQQQKDNVYGVTFSYGAQYDIVINNKVMMTIGYSGTSPSSIKSKYTSVVTRFTRDYQGNENVVIPGDTLVLIENVPNKLKMPLTHTFGFSIQGKNKWLVGADFRTGNWSKLTVNGANQGLEDTYGVSVGGSITPNPNAISGYFNHVDFRFGVQYDKTYVRVSNTDIKQQSVSIGFGFPFASMNRYSFSKLNFTAELGKRGTLSNNLVKENFINLHLGLTLNDTWFTRFKFD